jgi:hypothetical protein
VSDLRSGGLKFSHKFYIFAISYLNVYQDIQRYKWKCSPVYKYSEEQKRDVYHKEDSDNAVEEGIDMLE